MRERIDVSEIEAKTKIRAKYLRALENEEWGLLPGPDLRQELPAHLRRRRSAWTARRSSRSTVCTTSARARGCSSRSSPPLSAAAGVRAPAAIRGASRGYMIAVGTILRDHRRPDRAAGDAAAARRNPTREAARRRTRRPRGPPSTNTPRRRRPVAPRERRGDTVADADRDGLRVPARRRRAQADPGRRTAAGRDARPPTTPNASRSRSGTMPSTS